MQGLCECFHQSRRCASDTPQSLGGRGRCAVQPDALTHALWVHGGDFELVAKHGPPPRGYGRAREGCAPLEHFVARYFWWGKRTTVCELCEGRYKGHTSYHRD